MAVRTPHLPEVAGGIVIVSGVVLINRRSLTTTRNGRTPARVQHQAIAPRSGS